MTNNRLIQFKSIAELQSTFIKLAFVIKIFVLVILSGRFRQNLLHSDQDAFSFILAKIADIAGFGEKQLESHQGLSCLVKRVNSLMVLHTNGTRGLG